MKRKDVLIAVIGGCIGALVTMGVGLFAPVGVVAQSYDQDATFGTITCGMIKVVDERGITRSFMNAYSGIFLCDNEGKPLVAMGRDDNGGGFFVFDEGITTLAAKMGKDEHGGFVWVSGKDRGEAVMRTDEHGGRIEVANNQLEIRAVMGVNEYGNGAVSAWDKNGYRQ